MTPHILSPMWAFGLGPRLLLQAGLLLLALTPLTPSWAHSGSNTFIELREEPNGLVMRVDLPLRDLALTFDLDLNRDAEITWGELKQQQTIIEDWLLKGLALQTPKGPCQLEAPQWAVAEYGSDHHLSIELLGICEARTTEDAVSLRYGLFFDQNALHRALVKGRIGDATWTAVLSPDRPQATLDPRENSAFAVLSDYLVEGVWHIWIGADHILFLLALLLPSVFQRRGDRFGDWRPYATIRPAALNILSIVTAFTVAHSITLGLAVLGVVSVPSQLVEPVIAASVAMAALGNLHRRTVHYRWQIAFALGLVHGFGFASVLEDLGLPSEQLAIALIGFNVGVELGQLAIVAAFVPLAWTLRRTGFYRWAILVVGSIGIAAVGLTWFIERVMGALT